MVERGDRAGGAIEDEAETDGSGARRRESLEIDLDALRTSGEVANELPTLRTFAGYEILGRIAVGGMAEVFLARERGEAGSTRHVALKVIRPQLEGDRELAEMFLREGRVALGLRHPNVCHTYRFGTEAGHAFLALELVSGVTLRDLLARARRAEVPVPPAVAAKIASSVAEALHSAHVAKDERGRALGLVHQDVSPHNVMVAYDGTVKLLDFGVASTRAERALEPAEASHTTIRGKAAYLSPEQCTGLAVDARSDVFSLGIVLFELLTGARLFARPQGLDSMRAIASEPLPAFPPSIPPPLARILARALARAPGDRYPTAAAMQEDLERFLADARTSVTSARIAEVLACVLGDELGRAPKLDASPAAVRWLRAATPSTPLPVARPARPWAKLAIAGAAAAIAITAVIVGALSQSEAPMDTPPPVAAAPSAPVSVPVAAPVSVPTAAPAPISAVSVPVTAPDPDPDPVPTARRRPARRAPARPAADPGGFVDDPGF